MTEKEYFLKYCESSLIGSSLTLQKSKKELEEGYKKLQAEYNSTIALLEFSLEEAVAKRTNMKTTKTNKSDVAMADIAIKRAKKELEFGKIKAQSTFETSYMGLKNTVDNSNIYFEKAKLNLEFAKAECERGFTV